MAFGLPDIHFGHEGQANYSSTQATRSDDVIPVYGGSSSPRLLHQVDSARPRAIWRNSASNLPRAPHVCAVVEMVGPVDGGALAQSLDLLSQRHDILRATFPAADEPGDQGVLPPEGAHPWPLTQVDMSSVPEADCDMWVDRYLQEEATHPFPLATGPLCRASLLRSDHGIDRLVLEVHQWICDDFSLIRLLVPELVHLYAAHRSGALPPPPRGNARLWSATIADPLDQQRSHSSFEEEISYWRHRLAGASEVLDLPTDFPRRAERATPDASHCISIPAALAKDLRTLCRTLDVPAETVLLSAFIALLRRYTGQDDFVVGIRLTGRNGEHLQQVVGPLQGPALVRTPFSEVTTFRSLMGYVHDELRESQGLDFPLNDEIVAGLQSHSDPSRNPIFQAAFDYLALATADDGGDLSARRDACAALAAQGWSVYRRGPTQGSAAADLSLVVDDGAETMRATMVYRSDLFAATTVAHMADAWLTLLGAGVAEPEQRVDLLPILSPTARDLLLRHWGQGGKLPDNQRCLQTLFEEQAARTPDRVALEDEGGHVTYGELDHRADAVARQLRHLGAKPDTLVGVCLEQSSDLVAALLGVLKSGAAYVPLDPSYPSDRLAFMLSDTRAPIILTQSHLVGRLPPHQAHVICLDRDMPSTSAEAAAEGDDRNFLDATPDALAYVIYTSGSTGRPKGVMVTHRNAVNSTLARPAYYNQPIERHIWLYSYAFDASIAGLFWTLCQGGTLVIPARAVAQDATAVARLIASKRITVLDVTTTFYNLMLTHAQPEQLASLKVVIVGAEPTPGATVGRHYRLLPQVTLYNEYGPTETTIWSTVYAIPRDNIRAVAPIGRPIASTLVYVLDRHLQPVPVGVSGELYIGGAGVARGYLNRPDLTEERFLPNPFMPKAGRMYKTGDIVRYLPDGNLEFIGRVDTQVKVRGFRVELGEIEATLARHPAIRDAVVLVREDTPGMQVLTAYIISSGERIPAYDDLRRYLLGSLPEYMVPASVVALAAFPVSPNGKIDRAALPAPSQHTTRTAQVVAPRWIEEHQLVAIWEEVLGIHPLGITDSFFDFGGNSFLAARLIASVEEQLGRTVPLDVLFEHPTVQELAQYLLREDEGAATPIEAPAGAPERARTVPVQAGGTDPPFFYLHAEWRGGAFYCHPLARALGTEQPFYILQPYRFGSVCPPPSVHEIAAAHRRSLQAVQPRGPYRLGGFCAGALISYEIARQLEAAGEEVDVLLLMNPDLPSRRMRWAYRLMSRVGRVLRLSERIQLLAYLHLVYLERWRKFGAGRQPGRIPWWPSADYLLRQGERIFTWVASSYRPSGYRGPITLLFSSDQPTKDMYRWYRLFATNPLEVHTVPGDNMTCRTVHLAALAEHIGASLRNPSKSPVQATTGGV